MGIVLLISAIVVASPTSAAKSPYDEVAFTVLITDPSDHQDFWDIREVAVGEPGDETLVFRIKPNAWAASSVPTGSIDLFFTAKGTNVRSGITISGGVSGSVMEKCLKDGAIGYCVVSYGKLNVEVGDKITGTYAISYLGFAQDYAPGGHYEEAVITAAKGKNYVITGGPVKAPEAPLAVANLTVELPAEVQAVNGSAAVEIKLTNGATVNETVAVAVESLPENWTTNLRQADGTPAGNVTLAPGANASLSAVISGAEAPGTYQIQVNVTSSLGFAQVFEVAVTVPEPQMKEVNATASPQTGEQEADEASVPGFDGQLLLISAVLVCAGLVYRRRR